MKELIQQTDEQAAREYATISPLGMKGRDLAKYKHFLAGCRYKAAQQQSELEQLRNWKAQAIQVMPDMQKIGRLLKVPLGQSVHDKIIPGIQQMQQEIADLKAQAAMLTAIIQSATDLTSYQKERLLKQLA